MPKVDSMLSVLGIAAVLLCCGAHAQSDVSPIAAANNRTCVIENGFEYIGFDFMNVASASAGDCCAECSKLAECRAYTWTTANGGTCFIKSDRGEIVVNANAKSGLELYGKPRSCFLEEEIDYEGFDIGSAPSAQPRACCEICRTTLGCRAYSWSSYADGTCWLKSKRGTRVRKDRVFSASVYPASIYPPNDEVCVLEYGVDMVGGSNDLVSRPSATPEGCCAICKSFNECNAFTWTGEQNGMCQLKRSATPRLAGLGNAFVSGAVGY